MRYRLFVCLAGVMGVLGLAGGPVQAQYPRYAAPAPAYTPPRYFAGSSYSFEAPRYYSGRLPNYSSYYYVPNACGPTVRVPRYTDPGPYYYTPAYSWTPGYYSYYYTPGYFRY